MVQHEALVRHSCWIFNFPASITKLRGELSKPLLFTTYSAPGTLLQQQKMTKTCVLYTAIYLLILFCLHFMAFIIWKIPSNPLKLHSSASFCLDFLLSLAPFILCSHFYYGARQFLFISLLSSFTGLWIPQRFKDGDYVLGILVLPRSKVMSKCQILLPWY